MIRGQSQTVPQQATSWPGLAQLWHAAPGTAAYWGQEDDSNTADITHSRVLCDPTRTMEKACLHVIAAEPVI